MAASHDLGKLDPVFQGQLLRAEASNGFGELLGSLMTAGYEAPPRRRTLRLLAENRPAARHEILTGHYLRGEAGGVRWALMGHHGIFPGEETAGLERRSYSHHCALSDGRWGQEAERYVELIDEALGDPGFGSEALSPMDVMLLAGLVSIADWLASEDPSLAHGHTELGCLDEPAVYIEHRYRWFSDRLPETLGVPTNPTGVDSVLFGERFVSRNSIQATVADDPHAGLVVIAAPMGGGKTEAALIRHLEGAQPGEGLYFALPTMATADAMLDRVFALWGHSDTATPGVVAHGRAMLNAFYTPSATEIGDGAGGEPTRGLAPSDWFRGRHRPLLAPVAVGTCDQVLARALRRRYATVGLTAIANKHVVFDEVHTYDAYQSELLAGVLRWLGHVEARVTILSATLPQARADRFVAEYQAGRNRIPRAESVTAPIQYPGVLSTTPTPEVVSTTTPDRRFDRDLRLEVQVASRPAERIVDLAASHGHDSSVGVFVNTVDAAIEVADRLASQRLLRGVLHSRMTAAQRADAAERLRADYGRDGDAPQGVVVGTQVIEASLDVDFDHGITELAPAASMLQRSGRVWRHSNRSNGTWVHPAHRTAARIGLDGPPLTIIAAGTEDQIEPPRFPYQPADLHKAWRYALGNGTRTCWSIPNDLQQIIDDCVVTWDDSDDKAALDALLADATRSTSANRARIAWADLTTAGEYTYLSRVTSGDDGDDERDTRWNDTVSITVVPVGSHRWLWHNPGVPTEPTLSEVREVLATTIPVTGTLATRLLDAGQPSGSNHPLLRDLLVVHLNEVGDLVVFDPVIGLRKAT